MNKIIISFIIILSAFSCHEQLHKQKTETGYATKNITIVAIQQPILYQVLDSVITFEQQYNNCKGPLLFGFTVHDSIFWFTNNPEILNNLNWTTYAGCFIYNNNIFLSDDIDTPWFSKTNKAICFSYKKTNGIPPPPPMNDKGTIIQIKGEKITVKRKFSYE